MAVTKTAILSRGLIHITVAEQGPTPRKMRKAYSTAARKTWRETGKFHHKEHIPERFTEEGARELNFRDRTPKYNAKKGHKLPNVWSGTSRDKAKKYRSTDSKTGVKMRYNVPALNFGSGKVELRKSNQKEAESISKFYASNYEQQLVKETR